MNNLVASLFDPSKTLPHGALHFAFHGISFVASNSLLPLQLRMIHTEIPILWINFGGFAFLELDLLWSVVIKSWSWSYRGAVTPQTIHAAWLHHTFISARIGSWIFLHFSHTDTHTEVWGGVFWSGL